MGIQTKHIISLTLCLPLLAVSSGCATRSRPYQLGTNTGKPEIVVSAP